MYVTRMGILWLCLIVASQASSMEFVVVGEPGNAHDPLYGCGGVSYVFEIGKYKITNADYVEFLNAVARKGDPFDLYSESMATGAFGGIERSKTNNEYSYTPKPAWAKRPVVYVSWYDLARMTNWLHYGKPDDGTSRVGTTEGDTDSGAYDTRHFPAGSSDELDMEHLPRHRNPRALYWIPGDDEWYKAAYYDPTREGVRKYWDYAVRCCRPPNNLPPPGDECSANYFRETFAIGKPYFLTEVGAYPKAGSYFGTYDQNGNVWEWIEDWWQMRIDPSRKGRITRGGSATYSEIGLHAENRDPLNPAHEAFIFGGRLARAHVNDSGEVVFSTVDGGSILSFSSVVRVVNDAFARRRRLSFVIILVLGVVLGAGATLVTRIAWRIVARRMRHD